MSLWTEKYRPKNVSEYVFMDPKQKEKVEQWIKEGKVPNVIFAGPAGTGKTSLAKMLLKELKVHDADIKVINASKDNGVDYIRETVDGFCSVMPYGDRRYILLDESDFLSLNSQAALRNPMEACSDTVSFILTCNFPNRIMPALHSRCQSMHIEKMDKVEFTARMATILIEENVQFEIDDLDIFVNAAYPDLRKCINNCELNTNNGILTLPTQNASDSSDYRLNAVALFRDRKYEEARKLICKQIAQEEYEDFYRFMYENTDLWAADESQTKQVILAIRDGLVKDSCVADREINLAATLINLELIGM